MMSTVAVVLYLSAALQGVVLSGAILRRASTHSGYQVLLGCLVLAFSLSLAEFAAYWTPLYLAAPHLLFATLPFPLLFGPLVYGLVAGASGRPIELRQWSLHLIPFALYVGRLIPFYMATADYKREYYRTVIFTPDPDWPPGAYIAAAAVLLHLGIYLGVSWRRLRYWARAGGQGRTVILKLLRRFLFAWSLVLLFRVLNILEIVFFDYRYITIVDHALLLCSSLLIYATVYMMLGSGYEYLFGALRPPPEKYTRSTLAPSVAAEIVARAQAIMDEEQLFLDPDLRLEALASRLAVSRNHVSQSLNQQLGKSFNEFVNEYRVRSLKTRMSDPATAQSSMLELAFEAGFGTKATFNSAFKKATGLTPSAYRALQQAQPDQ
jgi:AraC-like DNA-binding protein